MKRDIDEIKVTNKFWKKVKKGKIIKQTKKEFIKEFNSW